MSTLHTVNRSPDSKLLNSCLAIASKGDGILFIEDGIYHCSSNSSIDPIDESIQIYGLREDMLARATLGKSHDRVEVIDTVRFVDLCCDYDKVMSWF